MRCQLLSASIFSLCLNQALAQNVVRFTPADTSESIALKSYSAQLISRDTLKGIAIVGKKDTLYTFHSINSRAVAFRRDKEIIVQELYALPVQGNSMYYLVPLREFSVNPATGKVAKNKLFLSSQLKSQLPGRDAVVAEYESLQEELKKRTPIDEYDQELVHRTAKLVWDLTLIALSGDEEFYSILTNIETALPSVLAGESGYAWQDCRFLLQAEKADGFND